jgi:hypothetical protein
MVINTQGSRTSYTGNGATTSFSFPNYIKLKSEIKVYLNGILQTLNTHYTIAGTEPLVSGANIVFSTAPANGVVVLIRRVTGLSQSLNLTNSGSFNQEGIEAVLDDVVLKTQDIDGRVEEFEINSVTAAESAAISTAQAVIATTQAGIATTQAGVATTQAGIATTQAGNAAASAGNAAASAGSASAIAAGSLYTGVIHSGATLTPIDNGGPYIIQATCEILLPAPTPNFNFSIEVVGNQTITLTRSNVANTIKVQDQTITDDVQFTDYGFYGITCLETGVWLLTKTESTNLYIQAPAGPAGPAGPTGPTGPTGAAGGPLANGDYGDITVSGTGSVFTLDNTAISSKTSATPVSGDSIIFSDVSDSNNLKKCLISELPGQTTDTTTYKTTADQVITFNGGIPADITGLLFTPVANTTYLVKANFRWVNSGGITRGGTFGHSALGTLNYVFANGVIRTTSGASGITYEKLTDNSPRSFLSTGSATGGEYQTIELMFRTGATVSGNFSIQAFAEDTFGDLTISKGAVMTVQVLAN